MMRMRQQTGGREVQKTDLTRTEIVSCLCVMCDIICGANGSTDQRVCVSREELSSFLPGQVCVSIVVRCTRYREGLLKYTSHCVCCVHASRQGHCTV